MKWTKVFAAIAGVSLWGCGGDVCSRAKTVAADLQTKASSCPSLTFSSNSNFTNACTARLSNCNAADQSLINKWFDCLEGIPKCVAGQENAFTNALISCSSSNLSGLSSACYNGVTQ